MSVSALNLLPILATLLALLVLMRTGLGRGRPALRRVARRCPSCGRELRGGVCPRCRVER